MPAKFIVYAYPRTGSYHLTSLLDSCADVVCHGEIFKKETVELREWHKHHLSVNTPAERDRRPLAFIAELRALNPRMHFGFKLFQSHIRRVPRLDILTRDDRWKIIVLQRDPLETYASILR